MQNTNFLVKEALFPFGKFTTPKYTFISSSALAVLTPLAFYVDPSALVVPIDLTLGVLIPFHGYVGLGHVIDDYVPEGKTSLAVSV